jgi:hypothetical protein
MRTLNLVLRGANSLKLCKFMLYVNLSDMLRMKIESRPNSPAFFPEFYYRVKITAGT